MWHRVLLSIGLLAFGFGSVGLSGQTRAWVVARVLGEVPERAAFAPRQEPYSTDGPSIGVPVLASEACQLPSGEACVGFEFIGWHEGNAIRVVVRALVAGPGAPLASFSDTNRLERRQITTVLLAPGDPVVVDDLRRLGVTPVELSTATR